MSYVVARLFARFDLWWLAANALLLDPFSLVQRPDAPGRFAYWTLNVSLKKRLYVYSRLLRALRKSSPGKAPAQLTLMAARVALALGRFPAAAVLYRSVLADSEFADEAECALRRIGWQKRSEFRDKAVEVAASISPRSPKKLFLVPLDSSRRELFQIWLDAVRKSDSRGLVLVLAIDEGVRTAVISENIIVCDHFLDLFVRRPGAGLGSNGMSNLWIARVNLISALLEAGYEVLSFDVDCVPVSSIASLWPEPLSPDILVQQDFSIPVDVARRVGFVICCGLMWCLPTAPAKRLLSELCREVEFYLDDQIAINKMIFDVKPKIEKLKIGRLVSIDRARVFLPDVARLSRRLHEGAVIRHVVIDNYGYQTVINYFRTLANAEVDGS